MSTTTFAEVKKKTLDFDGYRIMNDDSSGTNIYI